MALPNDYNSGCATVPLTAAVAGVLLPDGFSNYAVSLANNNYGFQFPLNPDIGKIISVKGISTGAALNFIAFNNATNTTCLIVTPIDGTLVPNGTGLPVGTTLAVAGAMVSSSWVARLAVPHAVTANGVPLHYWVRVT